MALSKEQLFNDLAESCDLSKQQIRELFEQLAGIVTDALENDGELSLPGIGKLKTQARPARAGRNPATGEALQIPAKTSIKLVPAKALLDTLNR